MTHRTTPISSAADVAEHLRDLLVERKLADVEGLSSDARYMADLEHEIAGYRSAYLGAAVTEIAILRGELSGRLQG